MLTVTSHNPLLIYSIITVDTCQYSQTASMSGLSNLNPFQEELRDALQSLVSDSFFSLLFFSPSSSFFATPREEPGFCKRLLVKEHIFRPPLPEGKSLCPQMTVFMHEG